MNHVTILVMSRDVRLLYRGKYLIQVKKHQLDKYVHINLNLFKNHEQRDNFDNNMFMLTRDESDFGHSTLFKFE